MDFLELALWFILFLVALHITIRVGCRAIFISMKEVLYGSEVKGWLVRKGAEVKEQDKELTAKRGEAGARKGKRS